jgi:hypothetical protein
MDSQTPEDLAHIPRILFDFVRGMNRKIPKESRFFEFFYVYKIKTELV